MEKLSTTTKIIIGVVAVLGLGVATGLIVKKVKKNNENNSDDLANGTNEVSTDDSQVKALIGKYAYVLGSEPYTNVRSSALIDNCGVTAMGYTTGGVDLSDYECVGSFLTGEDTNLILRQSSKSKSIGKIIEVLSTSNDGYTWYKIKFTDTSKVKGNAKFGFVREDAVRVKNK